MSSGFWLSDRAWETIEPLLPHNQPGARRVDDRRVVSGIIHVLRVGCRWQDCPAEYGPATTIYNRFNRWRRRGLWARIFATLSEPAACAPASPPAIPRASSPQPCRARHRFPTTSSPISAETSSRAPSAASRIGAVSRHAMTSSRSTSPPPSQSLPSSSGGTRLSLNSSGRRQGRLSARPAARCPKV